MELEWESSHQPIWETAEDLTKQTNKKQEKTTLHLVKDRMNVARMGLKGPANKHGKKNPRAGVVAQITHPLVSKRYHGDNP